MSKHLKNPSYNIAFHLSPEKKNSKQIHWHIEVYPVTNPPSALEKDFGIIMSGLSPEKAAEQLGATCRKELAILVGIE